MILKEGDNNIGKFLTNKITHTSSKVLTTADSQAFIVQRFNTQAAFAKSLNWWGHGVLTVANNSIELSLLCNAYLSDKYFNYM